MHERVAYVRVHLCARVCIYVRACVIQFPILCVFVLCCIHRFDGSSGAVLVCTRMHSS